MHESAFAPKVMRFSAARFSISAASAWPTNKTSVVPNAASATRVLKDLDFCVVECIDLALLSAPVCRCHKTRGAWQRDAIAPT
jgi:hypothetical protein